MTEIAQVQVLRIRSEYPVISYQWDVDGTTADTNSVEIDTQTECSVQVSGSLDKGSVAVLGSLDNESFYELTDLHGSTLAFTRPGIKAVGQPVRFLKLDPSLGSEGKAKITIITGGK